MNGKMITPHDLSNSKEICSKHFKPIDDDVYLSGKEAGITMKLQALAMVSDVNG